MTIGWVAGAEGTILRTLNGGKRWEIQETSIQSKLESICRAGTGLWVAGGRGSVFVNRDIPAPEAMVDLAGGLDDAIIMPEEKTIKYSSLRVESKPSKARITLNGRLMEERTSHTFDNLIPGRHEVKVSARNKGSVTKTVWLKEGEMKSVRVSLPNRNSQMSIFAGAVVIGGVTLAVLQFFAGGQ
jgi:hypothetical protein